MLSKVSLRKISGKTFSALYDGVANHTIHLDNLEAKVAVLLLFFSYDKVHVQQDSSPRPIKLPKLVKSVFSSDSDVFAEIVDPMDDQANLQTLRGMVVCFLIISFSWQAHQQKRYSGGHAIEAAPCFRHWVLTDVI